MTTRNKRPIVFASCAVLLVIVAAAVLFYFRYKPGDSGEQSTEVSHGSLHSEKEQDQSAETLPPHDIKVPPEPSYTADANTSRPQTTQTSNTRFSQIVPAPPLQQQWDEFVEGKPSREQLAAFLQQLRTPEMLDLMVYISQKDAAHASAMFAYDVIPILKQRWSENGQRWENNAPYDWLMSLASDTEKPPLFRMVMVDILGTGSRKATDQSIRSRMAEGLDAIGHSAADAEAVRAYSINKLGIISGFEEASPHAGLLRSIVVDQGEPGSVRGASITALSRIGDETAIPILQNICDEYQPGSEPEVARASVVALGDFARRHQTPVLDQIQNVLKKTKNRDVHASAMHAISLLDDVQFAESLPEIMETCNRFEGDSHTRNSLTAVLWSHPAAVMAGLNSNDTAVVSAAIQAATIVPLPPAKARLEQLVETRPAEEQAVIRAALEKAKDTEAYKMILTQNAKTKEEH